MLKRPNDHTNSMKLFRILLLILLPFACFAQSAGKHVEAQLVSEVEWIQPGQPFWVALRLQMDEGWHTYWRNPGDAGLPTEIEWQLPEGFSAGEIQWPYPERFVDPPLLSYGYSGEVLLPAKIQTPNSLESQSSVELKATANWLECKESCLPGSAKLTLTLPVKNSAPDKDTRWTDAFSATRKRLPVESTDWNIEATKHGETLVLSLTPPANFGGLLTSLSFCPYEEMILDNSAEPVLTQEEGRHRLKLKLSSLRQQPITEIAGVLISNTGWQDRDSAPALEIELPVHQFKGSN